MELINQQDTASWLAFWLRSSVTNKSMTKLDTEFWLGNNFIFQDASDIQ